ncbi:ATP-binding protein [Actinomycetospora chiangmaiensis]|uniref:ATP-binding protein n=1 Tax=Actinomycetospora chiangmaiensis TaxID=402650 RepID=UPI00037247C1|nr:ATP-binding protein [Actinomycetospora chiangmaiensis]
MSAADDVPRTEGPACVCWPEPEGAGVRQRLDAEPETVRVLRREVRAWLDGGHVDEETAESILLVVDEAVTNAVEHACPGWDCSVELVAGPRACGGGVSVLVADDGEWQPRGDPGFRGRGIDLIGRLAQRSTIETGGDGTTVRMCWPSSSDR